jgi:hypothetical protein
MERARWVVTLTLATTMSCGGTSGGPPIALDDMAAETTAAECALLVRCHFMYDDALCRAFYDHINSSPTFESLASGLAAAHAGKTDFDGTAARACVEQIRNADCGQPLPDPRVACAKAFRGKLADGDRCIADIECPHGSFCPAAGSTTIPMCNGVCTPLPHGTCSDDSQCPSGQVCDSTCVIPVPPGALDEPCGTHQTCQRGLHCELDQTAQTAPFVCKGPGHVGDSCSGVAGACDEGLICVPSDDRATVTCMKPAGPGEACQAFQQCGGTLLSSIVCDPTTHTCVGVPSSGPCIAGRVDGCNPIDSYCDLTQTPPVCLPVVAVGSPCRSGTLACGLFTDASCLSDNVATPTCTVVTSTLCAP